MNNTTTRTPDFRQILASDFDNSTAVGRIIDMMNHGFSLDAGAMGILSSSRVKVTEEFAEDALFPVEMLPVHSPDPHYSLSPLGMLNGVLEMLLGYRVASVTHQHNAEQQFPCMEGFALYIPPEVGGTWALSQTPWKEEDVAKCRQAYQWIALCAPHPEVDATGAMERLEGLIESGEFDGIARSPEDRMLHFLYQETDAWFHGNEDDCPEARGIFAASLARPVIEKLHPLLEAYAIAEAAKTDVIKQGEDLEYTKEETRGLHGDN